MPDPNPSTEFTAYLESVKPLGQTMLLPALLQAQQIYGCIPKDQAAQIAKSLVVPLAEITGMIEFYSLLKMDPVGTPHIAICNSPVCAARGSHILLTEIEEHRPDGASIEEVACLGLCDHAPAALVDDVQIGCASASDLLSSHPPIKSALYGEMRMITQWCDEDVEHTLDLFLNCGGFEALKIALSLKPDQVISAVKDSGLRGRGGAGFPTGIKWESAANELASPKYLVCNQDESEPGTFKDRALLLGDPFKIIEGLIIAGYAIGAEQAFFYIRGEYPLALKTIESALSQAQQAGYLGKHILGKDFDFDIEVRSGGGAYICGEETALFESIEGKRGFPRIKPPFPTTQGLYGKPTVINNVETIANIPLILQIGPHEYSKLGSKMVPGPRLLSVSGSIRQPGVYEISEPITLRTLIYEMAGGLPESQELSAVLLGGAAGKFVAPDNLDILLAEEDLREIGYSLGSGAIMVFDRQTDLKLVLSSLAEFFAHESCGKCYPCQLGTQRQAEIMKRVVNGKPVDGDVQRLTEVGWTMKDASLCGLGQTASQAILSAIELWPKLLVPEES